MKHHSSIHSILALLLLILAYTPQRASAQYVVKIAGNDSCGFYGDGGPATNASFRSAESICSDNAGNLYIGTNGLSACVRKISAAGIVTTIAGGNPTGSSADNIPATDAVFPGNPTGVCIDPAGNLLIADAVSRIRKVNLSTGIIYYCGRHIGYWLQWRWGAIYCRTAPCTQQCSSRYSRKRLHN